VPRDQFCTSLEKSFPIYTHKKGLLHAVMMPDTLIRGSFLQQTKFSSSRQWIKGQDAVQLVPWGMVNEENKKHPDLK